MSDTTFASFSLFIICYSKKSTLKSDTKNLYWAIVLRLWQLSIGLLTDFINILKIIKIFYTLFDIWWFLFKSLFIYISISFWKVIVTGRVLVFLRFIDVKLTISQTFSFSGVISVWTKNSYIFATFE